MIKFARKYSNHKAIRWCGTIFIFLLLGWVVSRVFKGYDALPEGAVSIQFGGLLQSSMILAFAYLLRAWVWCDIARAFGAEVRRRDGMRLYLASQAGRYLPGKVWIVAGAGVLGERYKIPGRISMTATLVSVLLNQSVGLLVALGALGMIGFDPATEFQYPIFVGLMLLFSSFMMSPLFPRLLKELARRTGRTLTFPERPFSPWSALRIVNTFFGVWLLFGWGFLLLLRATFQFPIDLNVLEASSVLAAACIAGFLVLLAPSGLGVREAVLAILLTPVLGAAGAAIASGITRLWMTIVELLVLLWSAYGLIVAGKPSGSSRESS